MLVFIALYLLLLNLVNHFVYLKLKQENLLEYCYKTYNIIKYSFPIIIKFAFLFTINVVFIFSSIYIMFLFISEYINFSLEDLMLYYGLINNQIIEIFNIKIRINIS
jgi:hypothetical protein